jgi:hypothetical protein
MTQWSKFSRAYEHLQQIDNRIRWFLDMKPYRFVREYKPEPDHPNPDRFYQLVMHAPVAPPHELPALIGDCLMNFRSALDHLIYDVALKHTKRTEIADEKRLQFAIYDNAGQFTSWEGEMVKKNLLPPDVLGRLKSFQPYQGWDQEPTTLERHLSRNTLWILNALVNADKHRAFMPVTQLYVESLTVASRLPGLPTVAITGSFKHGDVIFPYAWHADTPDVELSLQNDLAPDVAFGDEWPARGMPVSLLLHHLGEHIRDVVFPAFDPFL